MSQTINFDNVMKINKATINGTVSAINITDDFNKNGTAVKRGNLTVTVGDSDIVVEVYMAEVYNSGKENSSYKILETLAQGAMYSFDCSLEENKFVPANGTNEIARSYRIRVNFINRMRDFDTEGATFEYGGIVIQPLAEVNNREGDVVNYNIIIGQPQYYTDRGFNAFRFNVDPRNTNLINAVRENLNRSDTVKVRGEIVTTVTQSEVVEEALFGESQTKTYQNVFTNFNITGGYSVPENEIYSEEQIASLSQSTKNYENELRNNSQKTAPTSKAASVKSDPLGDMFG